MPPGPRALGAALSPEARGMLATMLAFAIFAVMDSVAKHLTGSMHPIQVVWARYASQMLFILIVLAPRLRGLLRTTNLRLQLLRSVFLLGATLMFFTSLQLMKLAEASALFQTAPLIITALAALVLGETVRIRRWTGVCIGLLGALIIIRPGLGVFQPAALLPVGAAFCLAMYQIATRWLSHADQMATTLLYTAGVGTLAASAAVPFVWTTPGLADAGFMLSLGAIAGTGHVLLVYGLGLAPASLLAPFNYTQLVWAAFFGVVIFTEIPNAMTVTGAAVIVGAGLYVWHRERRVGLGARLGRR